MMRRITLLMALLLLGLSGHGCGGGQGKVAGFKKGPMPAGFTWEGQYFCHEPYVGMNLSQTGSTVVGTVEYQNGKIEGTANGNILVFTWSQESGHSGLTGASKRITGKGAFQYKVEKTQTGKENHNIYGVWGYDQEMTGGGKWDCYKSKKDIAKVQKTLIVDEEGAVEAAEEASTETATGEEQEGGTTKVKGVGVKEKEKKKPVYEDVGPPDSGDERLEDLDDLDF